MGEGLHAPLSFPYNLGVLLALNAVSDAYLVLDGPGCSFYRGMMIHGRHDWSSTLLSADGWHRFQFCGVSADSIASTYEGMVRDVIRRVAALDRAAAVLATSLPMCTVAGTDYSRLLKEGCRGKPGVVVPAAALTGGWFEGYAAVLESLALGLDLSGGRPKPGNAAVVGYFMDRCEEDHRGNVAQLRRLLGRDVVSVWLSGGSVEGLRRVRDASTVVSLPHGRKAAGILAKRLGARLVEMDLPFGAERSAAWMEGRPLRVPRLGLRVFFVGDPHLFPGVRDICRQTGSKLVAALSTGLGGPDTARAKALWARARANLFIGNSDAIALLRPGCRVMEFGYPSIGRHCLREEPYLGFEGAAAFIQRMANVQPLTSRPKSAPPSESTRFKCSSPRKLSP